MRLKGFCKKEYDADSPNFNYKFRLKVGHIYEYEIINENIVMIFNGYSTYCLYQNMTDKMFPDFKDYFYTESEMRKLKLNKLNGSNL